VRHLDWSLGKMDDQLLTAACAMSFRPTVVALREPPRKLLATLADSELGVDCLIFEFEAADLKGELVSRLEAAGKVHRPGFVEVGEETWLRRVIEKVCEIEEMTIDAGGITEVLARAPRRQRSKRGRATNVYNLMRLHSELRKVRALSGGHASANDVRTVMNDWGRDVGEAWDLVSSLSSGRLENSLRIAHNASREGVWGFVSLLSSQARLVARVAAVTGKKHPSDAEVLEAIARPTPYVNWESEGPDAAPSIARVRRILADRGNLIWQRHIDFIETCAWAHDALVLGGNANANTVLELLCVRLCSLPE